jgi:O-antigen/teichoic acid export membrane protein
MSFAVVAGLGGAVSALAMLFAAPFAALTRLDVVSFRYLVAIAYTDALLAVPYAHLRMTKQSVRYAIFRLIFVGASIALNIVLISGLGWDVRAIFLANVVANLAVLALFAVDIVRLFRPGLLRGASWRPLWSYALPLIPATLAVMLVENGDRIVLNYLPDHVAALVYNMPSRDVVGIYSFNYKLGVAMLLVVQMFRMAWVPFSLQHAKQSGAPQLYSRVLTALMLVCAVVFLAVAVLLPSAAAIPTIHDYVKERYWLGLPIVPVILLGYVFSGVYAVVTAGLYIERRTHILARIAVAGAVLNLGLCALAAPRWGMVAVAWATPASYALMAGLGAWQANRVYPVPFEWRRLGLLALQVVLLFAVDRWIAAHGVMPLSPLAIVSKLALIAALPALLVATGFFRHGEMQALRSMLARRTSR